MRTLVPLSHRGSGCSVTRWREVEVSISLSRKKSRTMRRLLVLKGRSRLAKPESSRDARSLLAATSIVTVNVATSIRGTS